MIRKAKKKKPFEPKEQNIFPLISNTLIQRLLFLTVIFPGQEAYQEVLQVHA